MNIVDVFLISIGGTATALLIIGFLSKTLLIHLFTKEMENHKAKINHENHVLLEQIKTDLQQNIKNEDRQIEYEQIMKQYKGPLLHAVNDLQSRLYNIVMQGLVEAYLVNGNESERAYVINNTVYVVAQYFAWTEIIRREIQFIDFQNSNETKKLSELQDNIYSLWQTDFYRDSFRVWAGEQRAIGEIMIENQNGNQTCIGYASFLKLLEGKQEPLLIKLQDDVTNLTKNIASGYPRLSEIQHALIDILSFLDPKFIRFPKERRGYVTYKT